MTMTKFGMPRYSNSTTGELPKLTASKENLHWPYRCIDSKEYAVAQPIDLGPRYDPHMQLSHIAWVYTWGKSEECPKRLTQLNAWRRHKG